MSIYLSPLRRKKFLDIPKDDRPYSDRLREAEDSVTPEESQEIGRLIKGGEPLCRTVGDISRAMNMELMIVAGVIKRNIQITEFHEFRKEWI